MTQTEMKIEESKKKINDAICELRNLFKDDDTSLYMMCKISDYARLLNSTDFLKTITD